MLSDDEDLLRDHTSASTAKPAISKASSGLVGGPGERQRLLDVSDDDDHDFFLTGPRMGAALSSPEHNNSQGNIAGLQQQVREVTDVMRDNVNRMMDRGTRLDELQMRSESLSGASTEFASASRRLQRKAWWENAKAKVAIGGSAVVVVVIFIIIAFG